MPWRWCLTNGFTADLLTHGCWTTCHRRVARRSRGQAPVNPGISRGGGPVPNLVKHVLGSSNLKGVPVTAPTMEVNPEVIEQKIGVVFGALGGMVTSTMIHIGNELGLYRAMAGKGPITAARLAADAGLIERFVSE